MSKDFAVRLNKSLRSRRGWAKLAIIFGCFTVFGAIYIPQMYFFNIAARNPLPWPIALINNFIPYYAWAVLTPAVLWCGSRLPIERPHLLRNSTIHIVLSVVFAILQTSIFWVFNGWLILNNPLNPLPPFRFMISAITNDTLVYWMIIAIHHAICYFRKYKDREYRLVQAQLQALKAQLHPHFLFNTLNAISELVYRDPDRAERAIGELSDLLRITLGKKAAEEVALKDELEFLEKYVSLHRMLIEDRFKVEMRIDPEALDASVPDLILQPLVENAIRHGIALSSRRGQIEISAERHNGSLRLVVRDNGPGLAADWQKAANKKIGLSNTRARLERMYGKQHRFELDSSPGGGVRVSLEIPFKRSSQKANYESSYTDR